jgi:CDP-paratose synthetase
MKSVFITGISGYIGSRLAWVLLKKGYKVYGLVRQPLHTEYIAAFRNKLNLCVYDGSFESVLRAVKTSKPDVIYHIATCYAVSHSSDQISDMNSCNLLLGNYVLEAMQVCNIRNIVYLSSASCHFNNENYNPLNLYAATKQAFFDIMRYYTEAGDIRSLTLVLTDSYGPGDKRPKILNLIKKALRENQPIELSSGTQVYDVLYISDIVSALERAVDLLEQQKENSSVYQIYNNNPLSLRETVDLLEKTSGIHIDAKWGACLQAARSMNGKVRVDPLLPGWEARVSLEEGLKRFWNDSAML